MSQLPILEELVLVMGAGLVSVYVLRKVRVPPVVAFILTGVLIGPGGLNLVHDAATIKVLAQIGLVFLLFGIGLRFSLEELFRLRWFVLGAGSLQVVLTILATAGAMGLAGLDVARALLIGFLAAQSSTAIVLRIIEERGESTAPHGRLMLGILIFQDLAVIPLMLLVPLLGQVGSFSYLGAAWTLLKSALAVLLIIVSARTVIPWVTEHVVHTRNRELFTFAAVLIALGTAFVAERVGLSLALGALVAGIVISESQYSHQILAEVTPLRDALSSLFFVSIGMLLDPRLWLAEPFVSLGLIAGVIVLKAAIVIAVALVFGLGLRVAMLAGLGLAQVGEFAFVLAQAGADQGLLDGTTYARFLSVSVVTMTLAPVGLVVAPALSERLQRGLQPLRPRRRKAQPAGAPAPEAAQGAVPQPDQLARHVIIVGYGVNGRNVARVLREMKVRFIVLELNPATVRAIREQGAPVVYGDATQQQILLRAGIERARVLLITIPDPRAARQIASVARSLARDLKIIVRTRLVAEVEKLHQLGADEVVPEEFETSIALLGRVMAIYGASDEMIEQQEELLRDEHYQLLRGETPRRAGPPALREMLARADFAEITLPPDSPAVGRTLRDLDLRGCTGAVVMGISRGRQIIGNPKADFELLAGDVLAVLGSSAEVVAARELLLGGTADQVTG